MKLLSLITLASGVALAAVTPAAAAPFITIISGSGTYGNNDLTCAAGATLPCTFTDTINFTTPVGYNMVSLTLSSAQVGTDATTNVDFTTVTLNGVNFVIGSTGLVEFRTLLNQMLLSGANNVLTLSGTTGGRGSYSGTVAFAAAPVPEAATWAMMIAGFGVVGGVMRRRKTAVSFT